MAPDRKAKWRREIDWLLSVTDHIVEMVPSKQKSKDGTSMEVSLPTIPYLIYAKRMRMYYYKFTKDFYSFITLLDNDHKTAD